MSRYLKFAVLAGALALTAGFAATDPATEKSLAERARALWDARVDGDWSSVYRFLPQAGTAGVSVEQFAEFKRTRGPFHYQSAKIGDAAVDGDLGWVKINYTARVVGFPDVPARDVEIWDIWRNHDGKWYPIAREERERVPHLPPQERATAEAAALAERANAFWEAREKQDWAQIYDYLEPAYREQVSKQAFLERKALYAYFSHSLEWVEAIDGRGRVKVKYTRKLDDPTLYKLEPEETVTIEEWIKVDGQWYRRPFDA